jgi:cob(I)alamin adenosyltransferase
VDELSSYIGLARAALLDKDKPKGSASLVSTLKRIQRELYWLGTQLATVEGGKPPREGRPITAEDVAQLDREIAENDAELPSLRSFILPGGGVVASHLHVARAICRRGEREVVRLFAEEVPAPHVIPYLNRLSLALFSMARVACQLFGEEEELV